MKQDPNIQEIDFKQICNKTKIWNVRARLGLITTKKQSDRLKRWRQEHLSDAKDQR